MRVAEARPDTRKGCPYRISGVKETGGETRSFVGIPLAGIQSRGRTPARGTAVRSRSPAISSPSLLWEGVGGRVRLIPAFHPLPIPLPSRERGLRSASGLSVILNLMAVPARGGLRDQRAERMRSEKGSGVRFGRCPGDHSSVKGPSPGLRPPSPEGRGYA